MTIESILALFPQRSQKLAQAITRAGLHCIGCGAAQWETLEQGMQGHGKTADETVALVSELNRILAEPLELNTIQLTERAAIKFKSIREAEGHPEASPGPHDVKPLFGKFTRAMVQRLTEQLKRLNLETR